MRLRAPRRAAALLSAAALLLPGCFVLDELDKGSEIMEKNAPASEPDAAASAGPEEGAESARPAKESWWSDVRSFTPGSGGSEEANDPDAVVRCELRGSSRFMRRGDCLSQGGRPVSR